jgi:antitoxin YefM
MTALTVTEARARLHRLIKEAVENHQPILITGKESEPVLVSKEDWTRFRFSVFSFTCPR